MKIAIVSDVLGEENNGTTIASMNLIRSLKNKGHEVRVVCPDKNRIGDDGFFVVDTLNVGPFNGYVKKNGVLLSRPKKSIIEKALDGIDAVHVMVPFFTGCYVAKYCNQHGIPLSAGFHCQAENVSNHFFLMNSKCVNKLIYHIFYKHLYRYCDAIHYPTRFIRDVFEKEVGPTPGHVISNGVSPDFFKVKHNQTSKDGIFRILYTGRYSKEKSHYLLIEAVGKSAYKDRIQLIFAGQGPLDKKIREYSKKLLPIMPIIKFYSRSELIDVISKSDLYVHSAEIELEAISCLEAISSGLVPVINNSPRSATKHFALNEHNLFDYNDSTDLAKKIDYWIEHPKEREKQENDYRGFAASFAVDNCMDRMEEMILSIIPKH